MIYAYQGTYTKREEIMEQILDLPETKNGFPPALIQVPRDTYATEIGKSDRKAAFVGSADDHGFNVIQLDDLPFGKFAVIYSVQQKENEVSA